MAEGVDAVLAARSYLGVDHAAAVPNLHRTVVEQARAVARRRCDARWRLIGLDIADEPAAATAPPSIDEWAEREGFGDWSHDELLALYEERFGAAQPAPGERHQAARRQARNARLRERRLALLRTLEASARTPAVPSDRLDGWLPPALAQQLARSGDLTLADLRQRIDRGGRWWAVLPAYGPVKASRLRTLVDSLLGPPSAAGVWSIDRAAAHMTRLSGTEGRNRYRGPGAATMAHDAQAIERWVAARAGSSLTARHYQREAERFVLFCVLERDRALADVDDADCRAYLDFLQAVPEHWISRRKVARMTPGWAPFRGPLTIASQRQAATIVASLTAWLVQARYLASDPWQLVNRKLGDDPQADDEVSRAFTPAAWKVLLAAAAPAADHPEGADPSQLRLWWLCSFVQLVGLRASELCAARRAHLREHPSGWTLRVLGKGRRQRVVPVPARAIEATRAYFKGRGLDFDGAPGDTPLFASLVDGQAVSYSALNETFTRFVRRALAGSQLKEAERAHALRASAHWLRHTYGTRAAERGVPPDVLQENMGHSDPRTTSRYYRAQIERRQRAMEQAFSGD